MAFLASFALAFSVATGRLADSWSTDLARTSTIRISAPEDQITRQVAAVAEILKTTPGIASARLIEPDEQRELLAPWFGSDLPVESLPLPQLIEIIEDDDGVDPQNLALRLSAEAPGAIFDDHNRWKRPLVRAANRLRVLGWASLFLIGLTLAAMVTLAAQSALAANIQVIKVMRLVGARDTYIAQAFVRRFTLRSCFGATIGMVFGVLLLLVMPGVDDASGFLTGLRPSSWAWAWFLCLPIFTAIVAYLATRRAARRKLGELS